MAKLKEKSHLGIEGDIEVIHCRKVDVLIELNDALGGFAGKLGEGSQICEGYSLKDGA